MMATLTDFALPTAARRHLRMLDIHRDLADVADLIETCFADTLDIESRDYLQQMRNAARNSYLLHLASITSDRSQVPLKGFVWEEHGRIIGNLSLIPISSQGRRCFLIANVAVHPEFRGQGIGRAITTAALEYIRNHKINSAYLQVRDDNPAAIHIYHTLGFKERMRRTTWTCPASMPEGSLPLAYQYGTRKNSHWLEQKRWLEVNYPRELGWNVSLDWTAMKPGISGAVYRFFALQYPRHFIVQRGSNLLGVLTWNSTPGYADQLWLAAPLVTDAEALRGLLLYVRGQLRSRRLLALNYPAGMSSEPIQAAGFKDQQTLIWMEYRFS